ncbi:serine/threonine-protein kinase RsbW [Marivita hallyeonensis]|uniref:Serine/threonine-protein kinase RsbW n=2 Tax=Marivita hallyeonensis TaxID=996342 RepID=A0A1M5XSL6_9RHOB|nr:serine/threonine-protein kinase RsbW [Marivita hallyeonensis]
MDATTPLLLSQVDSALVQRWFEELRDDVRIVLAEVLNNIVEHGYPPRSVGAVAINMHATNAVLTINVRDWGRAYACQTLPRGSSPNPTDLAEGGYGWFLIRALVSELAYERAEGMNRLTLAFGL